MKYLKRYKTFEAKLPDSHSRKNAIKDMKIGQVGYTTPWAMKVDLEGNCFLLKDYSVYPEKGGTVCLRLKRVNKGYIAYIGELEDEDGYDREDVDHNELVEVIGFNDDIEDVEISLDDLRKQLEDAVRDEDYEKASKLKKEINKKL